MPLEKFLNKKVIVKQIRSSSKLNDRQTGCLTGLGLHGIGSSRELNCDNSISGMIKKVSHIVEVKLA